MKKILFCSLLLCLFYILRPSGENQLKAVNNLSVTDSVLMKKRLKEIKDIHKSILSRKEKKKLRTEIRSIKHSLHKRKTLQPQNLYVNRNSHPYFCPSGYHLETH